MAKWILTLLLALAACTDPLSFEESRLGRVDRCNDLENIIVRPGSRANQRDAEREYTQLRCGSGGDDEEPTAIDT